jgi:Bacterial capsule synthesis protein PGA_cap
MTTVGAGADAVTAGEPSTIRVNGSRLAVLAYDATRAGLPVGDIPGVVPWDDRVAKQAIESATARSDLVIVSLHGGVEYLPEPDPRMIDLAEKAISWGADIVWGHGAHVVQPLIVTAGTRPTLTATSLGNFIFDQRGGLTGKGAILQVLADRSGLIAYRMGSTTHTDLRVNWVGWELPRGDAVLIDGEWWNLIRQTSPRSDPGGPIEGFEWGEVVATSAGRVTGDDLEMVVSFRHVPGPHPVRDGLTDIQWLDAKGMSAHLGIYRADDMTPIWVAGMVPAPIADLAACDGSVALAYSELDNPEVIATGAAVWRPFGLDAAERLPGTGTPVCSDIDGDGSTEPVILDRGTANP